MADTYLDRIEKFIYSRTDEKKIVSGLIHDLIKNKPIEDALDIGTGPGLITKPLYDASKSLTLIEMDAGYADTLRKKFPKANLRVGSFLDFNFRHEFDVILCSHVLYYVPEDRWLEIFKKFISWLREGGRVLCVINIDKGDWWKVVNEFKDDLKASCKFYYQPWSQFKEILSTLGKVASHPYTYSITYEDYDSAARAVGKQWLQIYNDQILEKHYPQFLSFVKKNFPTVSNHVVMTIESELTSFCP